MLSLFRHRQSPLHRPCAGCGGPSQFGYGEHPETKLAALRPLCLPCLKSCLSADYDTFENHAVIVEPVEGAPVYVFQSLPAWQSAFSESPIPREVEALLSEMEPSCRDCGCRPAFIWLGSDGLTSDNVLAILERGLYATLLQHNQAPVALCATCCVVRIVRALALRDLSYIEVCSPRGTSPGIVLPKAY